MPGNAGKFYIDTVPFFHTTSSASDDVVLFFLSSAWRVGDLARANWAPDVSRGVKGVLETLDNILRASGTTARRARAAKEDGIRQTMKLLPNLLGFGRFGDLAPPGRNMKKWQRSRRCQEQERAISPRSALFCSVLLCSVLCSAVLFCSVLCCAVLYCAVLLCYVLLCSVM
eukprot:gene23020-biopygen11794